jgi:ABC-type antimicrobial peptide transport system permease subunit
MPEFGVRLALVAGPAQVGALVLGEGLRLAALGAAVGLLGTLAAGRVLQGLLHGVSPGNPITLAAAAVLMVATATAAALPTVLRTARLDPVSVLRDE